MGMGKEGKGRGDTCTHPSNSSIHPSMVWWTDHTFSQCILTSVHPSPSAPSLLQCPPGFACASTSSNAMTACTAGSFSIGRQASCTSCPAGFACPSTASNIQVPCGNGTFSTGAQTTCTPCPAGRYCTASANVGACAAGSFSLLGDGVCTPCPAGYACPSTISSAMTAW